MMFRRMLVAIILISGVFFVGNTRANFAIFQTSTSVSSSFPDATSTVDLNFQTNVAFGCASVVTCVVPTNNGKYTQASNNIWTLTSSNTLPWSDLGVFPEHPTTSAFTNTRDLTNSAWTKSVSMTAAKTAIGIDGVANAATTLTAGAVNQTVC